MSSDTDPQAVADALTATIDAFNEDGFGIPTREDGADGDLSHDTTRRK